MKTLVNVLIIVAGLAMIVTMTIPTIGKIFYIFYGLSVSLIIVVGLIKLNAYLTQL